tara:strand:+ start:290 stop:553 length:264 start_codon:yes stop_codon:yes gene_type:complete
MKLTKSKIKQIIREEIAAAAAINEQDYEKVQIPAQVKRYMNKFVDELRSSKLNRMKQVAILLTVMKGLNISSQDLVKYMGKIKKGLK